MRQVIAVIGMVLVAGTVMAADITFRVDVTIADADVPTFRAMLDGTPSFIAYSNVVTVVDGVSTTNRIVVVETDRKKAARVSAEWLEGLWERHLTRWLSRVPMTTVTAVGQ